jgi:hypothetical protein
MRYIFLALALCLALESCQTSGGSSWDASQNNGVNRRGDVGDNR